MRIEVNPENSSKTYLLRQLLLSNFKFNARTVKPQLQTRNFKLETLCFPKFPDYFCAPFKVTKTMSVTRLKRKGRKDKAKSAVRRQSLKIQNFQPVIKNVDVEKIKEEFKASAKKA